LSVSLPVNSHSPCVYLPNTACPVCLACESSHKQPNGVLPLPSHPLSHLISINSNTLSSHGLISPGRSPLHPLARHLLEFLLPLPNSARFRNIQKPSTMSPERKKGCWRGMDPDEQIEAALKDGLSEDRSGIDSNPVHRGLVSDFSGV
jgi:hypothetical protein